MKVIDYPVAVAYNMQDKKIGCPLAQAALGATIQTSWVSFNFDAKYWELNPSKCSLYKINSEIELDFMKQITIENN